jgi:hypothetical protein
MPMRFAVRMTRQAISPRLAIRILSNMTKSEPDQGRDSNNAYPQEHARNITKELGD